IGNAPTVSGVNPASGPAAGGTNVTITGTNFTSGATVAFGPNAATNVVISNSTQITATSPPGSGTVDVTVTTPSGGISATNAQDKFPYQPPAPAVTSISPSSGPAAGGTTVTISGTNF